MVGRHRRDLHRWRPPSELFATVVLAAPGLHDALTALLLDAVRDAASLQGDLLSRLSGVGSPEELTSFMSNPEALLDGLGDGPETASMARVNAAVAALSAVVTHRGLFRDGATRVDRPPRCARPCRRHRLSDARGGECGGGPVRPHDPR
jgi:hypothetical protein